MAIAYRYSVDLYYLFESGDLPTKEIVFSAEKWVNRSDVSNGDTLHDLANKISERT